jgi:hypothetical protein
MRSCIITNRFFARQLPKKNLMQWYTCVIGRLYVSPAINTCFYIPSCLTFSHIITISLQSLPYPWYRNEITFPVMLPYYYPCYGVLQSFGRSYPINISQKRPIPEEITFLLLLFLFFLIFPLYLHSLTRKTARISVLLLLLLSVLYHFLKKSLFYLWAPLQLTLLFLF